MRVALKGLVDPVLHTHVFIIRYDVLEGIILGKTRIVLQGADKPLNKAAEHANCGSCSVR